MGHSMTAKPKIFLMLIGTALLGIPTAVLAKPNAQVRRLMHDVYDSFKDLQIVLSREDDFLSPKNDARIKNDLMNLDFSFHDLGEAQNRLKDQPGFTPYLKIVGELMDDASVRFKEGKKKYSFYRLRTATNYCIGCHTTFNVHVEYWDPSDLSKMNFYQKGEFLLASRQVEKAERAYLAAAYDPSLKDYRMPALRKWLVINTRIRNSPEKTASEVEAILQDLTLPLVDRGEVESWLFTLRELAKEKGDMNALDELRSLLKHELELDRSMRLRDPVRLIVATGRLHRDFDRNSIKNTERGEALYLLGAAYNKLIGYFVEELPEFFLIQCIEEYPNTDEAKQSYALYEGIIILNYGGISGLSELPDDVELRLKELRQKAYGEKPFFERVSN